VNLRERRQARREILAKAREYAAAGKSIDELQADLLDAAEEKDGDITVWIQLITVLLPLLLELFAKFKK
jgi:hypothetical protein